MNWTKLKSWDTLTLFSGEMELETRQWLTVDSGGQKIFGMLHRPLGVCSPPVVIFLHGFASNKYGHNRSYVTFAEALAKEGIASVRFDFRGSGDSEGSPSTISFEDLIEDALSMFRHVLTLEGIDRERVGLFGSSLGGTIGILAMQHCPWIRTLVLWAPIASGELWVRDFMAQASGETNQHPLLATYRGVTLSPAFREQFVKMDAVKALPHLPLLHMHGARDQIVSPLHQQAYRRHCEQWTIPAHFLSFPDAEHILGTSTIFPTVIKESLAWFDEHLSALSKNRT